MIMLNVLMFMTMTEGEAFVPVYMFLNCNLEDGEFLYQKARKKFRPSGEDQTLNPQSSSLDALATKLLEVLWRAGSEFNYKYTSFILIQLQTLLG